MKEKEKVQKVIETIDRLYRHLETEKAEALRRLGDKTALHIADFHGLSLKY